MVAVMRESVSVEIVINVFYIKPCLFGILGILGFSCDGNPDCGCLLS